MKKGLSELERFWSKVNKTDGCWEWNRNCHGFGYGYFNTTQTKEIKRISILAHRYSYELHYGSFDKKLCVLHRCDNPKCCNPDHLFLGTLADNIADMMSKGRQGTSHHERRRNQKNCLRGHEFNKLNTYFFKLKTGSIVRHCKACHTIHKVKNRLKKIKLLTKEEIFSCLK